MTNNSTMETAPSAPQQNERLVFEFGAVDVPVEVRAVSAGPLSAKIYGGALRELCFGEVELVRQIDFPIRDQDWVTLPPRVTFEKLETRSDGFRYERRFEIAEGGLVCRLVYEGSPEGAVTAFGEATATHDFVTNRTGFTVLHPLVGVAGRPVDVTTPSGLSRRTMMPDLISPAQPIKDIAGLKFEIEGVKLNIAFVGEVFEMEDQRNWSDASFKTYCRPLVEPFAYVIPAGSTVHQEIRIRAEGGPRALAAPADAPIRIGAELSEAMPEILLAGEAGWLPDRNEARLLVESGLKTLLLRVTPENAASLITEAKPFLYAGGSLDLEILLDDDAPAAAQLNCVARSCDVCASRAEARRRLAFGLFAELSTRRALADRVVAARRLGRPSLDFPQRPHRRRRLDEFRRIQSLPSQRYRKPTTSLTAALRSSTPLTTPASCRRSKRRRTPSAAPAPSQVIAPTVLASRPSACA